VTCVFLARQVDDDGVKRNMPLHCPQRGGNAAGAASAAAVARGTTVQAPPADVGVIETDRDDDTPLSKRG
jgi:hypothetical protein